jgi:hypothetical protein
MIDINREELAWAAGFFDGEGSISISQTNKNRGTPKKLFWHTNLEISQSGELGHEVLNRFKISVGNLGKVYGPYPPAKKYGHTKIRYRYMAYKFGDVQAIIAMLWNWLGTVKREQISNKLSIIITQYQFQKSIPQEAIMEDE